MRDLERYRRKGPDATSRLLIAGLVDQLRSSDSLLDVGAGVGVVDFELLAKGVQKATLIDASPAYLDAAAREAQRRGVTDRIRSILGDFTALAGNVEPADIVTMHRVICCYPDHAALLRAAMDHTRRVFAFSYPRDRWFIRAWLTLENLRRRILRNPFRTFVHPPATMDGVLTDEGFRRVGRSGRLSGQSMFTSG